MPGWLLQSNGWDVCVALFLCSQKSKKYKKVYGNKKGQQDAVTSQPSGGPSGSGGQGGGGYVKRITNDDREDQMEQNLQ